MYSDIAKKRAGYCQTSVSQKRTGKYSMSKVGSRQGVSGQTKFISRISIWVLIALVVIGVPSLLCTFSNDIGGLFGGNSVEDGLGEGCVHRAKSLKQVMSNDGDEHGPRIKGIRLGMDYNSVKGIVEKLVDKINEEDPERPAAVKCTQKNLINIQYYEDSGASFGFNNDKLSGFGFSGGVLKALFGLSPDKFTYDQFLQMLLDNYGIPEAKTRVYTRRNQSSFGTHLFTSTRSYFDGSATGGYEFRCGESKGTGVGPSWSFGVASYKGLDFNLPKGISSSYVKNYEHGFGLVIKGFQLGMTRAEVIKTVKCMMPYLEYTEEGDVLSYTCAGRIDSNELGLEFEFKNGKACRFCISGRILEVLFRVDPEYYMFKDFVQRAIDNYHIPDVKGDEKSSGETIFTSYRHIGNGLEFFIGEIRTGWGTRWEIAWRQLDSLKLD